MIASHAAYAGHGDSPNLIPEVRFSQDAINAESVPFNTLFFAGEHIFSNRFTTEDHYGEAPDGPRRALQSISGRPNLPYLRFNGLDAQSCQDCHFFIGHGPSPTAPFGMRFPREPGATGGGAGFAANVFIFKDFPLTTLGVVRNPPHVFGLGYVQRLAEEMSGELFALQDQAVAQATASGRAVRVELLSKGVSFGHLTALPNGRIDPTQTLIEGVSSDLIVRPFQFKGIASTLRNFIIGAMNFHFSVQPKESLDRALIPDDNPNGTLIGDPRDEILEGDISCVALLVGFMRPPMEDATDLDPTAVDRGRQVFSRVLCASCHIPSLRVEDPLLTIMDPRILLPAVAKRQAETGKKRVAPQVPDMVNPEASSEDLQPLLQYRLERESRLKGIDAKRSARLTGYTRSLNLVGPLESLPRLPYDSATGAIDVPLFSDLKRHRMGADLAESFTQATDVAGIVVAGDEYLTRPLWGVADTGPWLHDGRALTLKEAILMHEGVGSEANASIGAFKALEASSQEDVHQFLLSLRLRPLGAGVVPPNLAAYWERY